MKDQTPHIIVAQDDAGQWAFQRKELLARAADRGLDIQVSWFDLHNNPEHLLSPLRKGDVWCDWLVADLMLGDSEKAIHSTGLNLIRQIVSLGLFSGYKPPESPRFGVRCIGVYSAYVGAGGEISESLSLEFLRLGVSERYATASGKMELLGESILDELEACQLRKKGI